MQNSFSMFKNLFSRPRVLYVDFNIVPKEIANCVNFFQP